MKYITKELLTQVLNRNVDDILIIYDDSLKYQISSNNNKWGVEAVDLNLDTLNRKCKEWLQRDCNLEISFKLENQGAWYGNIELYHEEKCNFIFSPESELELILKATEWVLKEKGYL